MANPEVKCRSCGSGINSATFHCDCGETGEYECPYCNLIYFKKSKQNYLCGNCGQRLIERGPATNGEPVPDPNYKPIPGGGDGRCPKCRKSWDDHSFTGRVNYADPCGVVLIA